MDSSEGIVKSVDGIYKVCQECLSVKMLFLRHSRWKKYK